MRINIVIIFLAIVILQTLFSGAMSQEMVHVLVPSPNSPINTSSGVSGSLQCTKNSDESYAVCASYNNIAVKYNLQPFSFAAKGPDQGDYMYSCDLYETDAQSTSRAVCVKGYDGTNGTVYFHRVSDMAVVTNVTIGTTNSYPQIIVDTPNQIAYIGNGYYTPAIYKITNIGASTPVVVEPLNSFDSQDSQPSAMLIVDGFLYVHFYLVPARLARIILSTFTWNQTISFVEGEGAGQYDNLANDDNFIYGLTDSGFLVRCTYKNNNFARFDSLNTGLRITYSLAISPDSSFFVLAGEASGVILINTSTFSIDSSALLPNPTSSSYATALGRPIILSKNNKTNTYAVCAFSQYNDFLYTFNISRVPFREVYPTIYPLPSSSINTSSGVSGSLQCTKNSDESYAVCASYNNIAVKYNLQPFSFAAKGPNQGDYMRSCDLYETDAQSTSRAVCVKGNYETNGTVYFHRVSDMINITFVTIGKTGDYCHAIVDTPNQIAFISNNHDNSPVIYKITNIGSSTPIVSGNITSFGSGDQQPVAMLIIDGFLYVQFYMYPARLTRITISTFTWNQTVTFADGERNGYYDNLANDDNFIYDLTTNGILVRCTFKNNNFARFDSLNTGLGMTYSLAISPDLRTLFVMSNGNSILQIVDVASFSTFGNTVLIPSALGRPIVTSSRNVYAFGQTSDSVYAFQYTNLEKGNTSDGTVRSTSARWQSSSKHSTPSPSLLETAAQRAGTITKTETKSNGMESRTPSQRNQQDQQDETPTLSLEADSKIPFIQKISESVASALVASDATQAIAVVSVAIFGSISSSPVLGFNVGRQQAMTNFAKKSLEGDCRGLLPATTVNEFEKHISNPLGLGDSPTQMSIGGSEKLMSYYVGAVVGDFILTFGLVLLSQGIGMGVMKYFENKKNNSAFGKMVRDRMKNNNKNKESTFELMRRVFATSYVSLTLFFCLSFLLTPILSSSLIVLVAAMNDAKLKDHEVGVGLKILCVVLAAIFCAVAVYFVVWSVFVRKQRKEKYRILKQEMDPGFVAKLFKAEGEWCYPNPTSTSQQQNLSNLMKSSKKNNKNDQRKFLLSYHNFLIAEPTFESYRDTIWFCSIEIISAILLAFPPFFAQFSSSAKGSCLVQGIMLLIILLVYTILLIWKNPFKLRILRIMNPVLAVQQLVIVLISLITAATRRSNDDDGESPSWLWKVIIIPLGFQGAMSFMMIGAAFFPFVMFLKKLKGRMSRNEGQNGGKSFGDLRDRRSPRNTERHENSVEMLPRGNKEKTLHSNREHHHDYHRRNSPHNSGRNKNEYLPSAVSHNNNKNKNRNRSGKENSREMVGRTVSDEPRRSSNSNNNNNNNNHNHTNVRNRSNGHHRRDNNHETSRRTLSDEREHQISPRNNNNNEQREKQRCAQMLNVSPSTLSRRRQPSNSSRDVVDSPRQDRQSRGQKYL